jgi:cyclic pyranopterin phosphate synthase
MAKSNHIDNKGNIQMVDIGNKPSTKRKAIAIGSIYLNKEAMKSINDGLNKKGNVLVVAQIAGIQAAKNTSSLIPLTHSLNIVSVNIEFNVLSDKIECTSEVNCDGKTGVEIEALCAVQISLLTIYDMCKYIDKNMTISDVHLVFKEGGKSGQFKRGQ